MSTIKDVAKLAGVSISTVSRALSGRTFVEEETKKKVLNAVKELDYQPNLNAKGLREGRAYTIALMVPDINSLFYPSIMKAIEHAAFKRGYHLILCNTNEDLGMEKGLIKMLGSSGVGGVICLSVTDDIRHLIDFQEEYHIPVVLVNRDGAGRLNSVSIDHGYGGYLMTKVLLEKGHRKIAGMFGSFDMQRFRERYNGCKRAMEEYGIVDYKRYFIYDVSSIDEACQRTVEMLRCEDRPTAFFATIDMMAIGIYSGIDQCGLKIPQDISVAGFDDIFMTRHMIPPLSTYNASVTEIAEKSVELLMRAIDNDPSVDGVILQGTLMERQSIQELTAL